MNDPFDALQDRLTRLEAGETLDAVCADLPEAEAGLVKMAAALWAVPAPDQAADVVAAQRDELLHAAKSFKALNTLPRTDEIRRIGRPARARWVWPVALASGAAAAFACVLVVAALAGAAWLWQSARQPAVAQHPTPAPGTAPEPAAPNAVVFAAPDPQHAVLQSARGLVEIQASDGTWAAARAGHTIAAGQRLRTGALSSASLTFYDGSQARLGPNTEVSVDALDAQTAGPRVIALTQWIGETDHDVAPSTDAASRYEVATPSGVGSAKGTSFHVLVTVALLVRFDVDEGAVAVTSLNVTVIVVAGQTTLIPPGEPPQEPVFHIRGEGEVTERGDVWRIGGQTFLTNSSTTIIGDPQVGDWVAVEGRILPDGTHFADRITLLHRSTENKFSFVGPVEVISDTQWTIAGRVVHVDELTTIEAGIAVGDQVEVRGGIARDGTLWASSIELAAANGFEFTGVVQSIAADSWTISGISVTVNLSTTIEAGIVVSDVVHVEGEILDDGTWLAASIEKAAENTFDFTGVVISTDPWNVSGVELETDENTEIDEGIDVGNRVRVRGRVLADGTWLAESIEQIDEGKRHHVEFTARVQSIDPWIVGGVPVSVTVQTKIDNDLAVGDLATVKGNLLPDGTVVAKEIKRARQTQGCLDLSVVVSQVSAEQVVLLNGQVITLDQRIKVKGKLDVASVVIIHICADEDGQLTVVSITVVHQLDKLPPLSPPGDGKGRDKDKDKDKDCKEGPGRGLGHCKDKDENDEGDDD